MTCICGILRTGFCHRIVCLRVLGLWIWIWLLGFSGGHGNKRIEEWELSRAAIRAHARRTGLDKMAAERDPRLTLRVPYSIILFLQFFFCPRTWLFRHGSLENTRYSVQGNLCNYFWILYLLLFFYNLNTMVSINYAVCSLSVDIQ